MRDVSEAAGVSTMTVSRVLKEPSIVSEATRERVMRAVEELGYVPDFSASSLSSRKTNFVGLILPTLTNSNFADTAQALADALGQSYQLLIGYTLYQASEEERLVRSLLARRPDALAIAGSEHTRGTWYMLRRANIPIVEIWDTPNDPLDHAVGFSNFAAGRAAAEHFIARGHHRIAALGSAVEEDVADHRGEARLRGFSAALCEHDVATNLIRRVGRAPVSFDHGARALAGLLDRNPDVEAVFAVSDVSAFGALMECRRRGIAVPDCISIMGFGDFEIGRQCEPAISTIHVDARSIGVQSGELIRDLLAGEGATTDRRIEDVGVSVIDRVTTR
ncbi:LacI family DNA-binding transcriptional regulator [Salinisphaera sp. USBA-960]|uniref:LacI family DNA-binding transcriptional regulator n=1 Tax=Salinisphaera orenii TaxID=856731 RepID=UPI000DBE82C7|nr:LacI family DNA-binding transcriptional regulator [Salifodinibacter halophilus]NNC25417.1 LacI family DNA-binding transcriptional regulator [Salifodinibacter halophilus]